jgi:hypothetical protein
MHLLKKKNNNNNNRIILFTAFSATFRARNLTNTLACLAVLSSDYVCKICYYCSVNISVLYVKLKTSSSNVLRRDFRGEERDLGFITIMTTRKRN